MTAELFFGTQGWAFDGWTGTFYPHGTVPAQMLSLYARAFPAVEVDSTAYSLPPEPVLDEWVEATPDWFRFVPRIPQEITHERRLFDAERVLRRFVSRVSRLGERLGPFVVPLSPAFRPTDANRDTLRAFLERLPEGFRWSVEFRHPGWLAPATLDLLRDAGVATVLADARWVRRDLMADVALEPTAGFAVLRWAGTERRFTDISRSQVDRDDDLAFWRDVVGGVAKRVDSVFGFFDNQFQGHGPHSAQAMQDLMGIEPVPLERLRDQHELL